MSQNVEVTFSSNDAGVIAYLQKQQAEVLKNQERLLKMGQAGKKAGDDIKKAGNDSTASLQMSATQIAKLTALWGSATAVVGNYMTAVAESHKETAAVADSLDLLKRKFQVQSGIAGQPLQQAETGIEQTAIKNAVTLEQGYQAATQLVSSGFTPQEASGGSLDAFLQTMAASNLAGKNVDPTELAKAISGYLESQGMEKTAGNVSLVGQSTQRLFKSSNLQLSDLPALAKEGAALRTGLKPEEQLASFASLLDVGLDSGTAATGLRNVSQRLQTARGDDKKLATLESMGITPEQVDLVGEDFLTAIERVQSGVMKLPEAERATAIKSLFEEAGSSTFSQLAGSTGKIRDYITAQQDTAGFAQDVSVAQSGRNAAKIRLQAQIDQEAAKGAELDEVTRMGLDLQYRQQGMSDFQRKMRLEGTDPLGLGFKVPFLGYDTTRVFGYSPEESARQTQGFFSGEAEGALSNVREAYGPEPIPQAEPNGLQSLARTFAEKLGLLEAKQDRQNELAAEQNRLMREQNELLRQGGPQPAVPRSSGDPGKPPGRRPSSALSK